MGLPLALSVGNCEQLHILHRCVQITMVYVQVRQAMLCALALVRLVYVCVQFKLGVVYVQGKGV